jgi:4-amino-4-deoxy-L-arabinose transferase-like glycosyltransferase
VLYTAETIRNPISGGDPSSGPVEARAGFGNGRFPGAGPGAFPGAADLSSAELVSYLVENRGDATWLLAVGSANEAAPLQLASGVPVMAMGGFSGSDPALTLDALQSYVREGKLRYVMVSNGGHGGRFGGGGQDDAASARNDWITSACP